MTVPTPASTVPEGVKVSDEDQALLDSGDYVYDPIFGVQAKTPAIARRDRNNARAAKAGEVAEAPQTAPVAPVAPSVPVAPLKTKPTPETPST